MQVHPQPITTSYDFYGSRNDDSLDTSLNFFIKYKKIKTNKKNNMKELTIPSSYQEILVSPKKLYKSYDPYKQYKNFT